MIVVMKPGASKDQVQHVIDLVREYGLKEHPIVGTDRTVIACIGDKRAVDKGAIENAPMVEKIVPILAPYKMASTEVKQERSQIEIGPEKFPIGGPKVGIIAGPCAVENEAQIMQTAEAVKQAGCIGLRGGAYKPRTSPYSFQGLREEGLKLLAKARDATGLAVVTEVISVETMDLVCEHADVLQIGARNMQNYPLLEAAGEAGKPVLLKRGLSSTLNEWLLAAEYIINGGNKNVILCERGIRTYEDYCRNTLPLTAVPELNERTHLPVVVDPSHGTGHAHLVPAMCRAAVAAGADGLIVEVHHDPEHAMSDGAQSITPAAMVGLMPVLNRMATAIGRDM
ncbi:MAG: 3-deoxy-7-phosphoheptulonate synthase [Planctomycetes bacterium]|jgi:3-deoxy-7-phosphoheptulonate synthase|nr:3-deoxy-7-phosphoheptulonate synthase [Planctomycetota bacterium]